MRAAKPGPVAHVPARRAAKRCVLVVDDEPLIREMLALTVRSEGYAVLTAANGRDALQQLQANSVDVILLDLMMPVMDGRKFRIEQLLQPGLAHIPVIVLTAAWALAVDMEMLQPVAFVSKPFDLEVVLQSVAVACAPAL